MKKLLAVLFAIALIFGVSSAASLPAKQEAGGTSLIQPLGTCPGGGGGVGGECTG